MLDSIATHLWQSTFFAIAVALLTVAFRRNRARVRFWLWLTASLKFFIPFALLLTVGTELAQKLKWETAAPVVSIAVEYVAMPFGAGPLPAAPAAPPRTNWIPFALLGVWLCGALTVIAIRARMWLRIRALLRASMPIEIPSLVEVRSAPGLLEPGVVGGIAWLRPILLLPEGILETLTPSQLEAVLAHELCHVRRRDNLFAAIQMIAEAIFWFHPLVWWIGARLVEERERACDEDVLTLGNEPRVYADAILNVCKLYAESPLVCVAGVTGSDIRARIEAIMTNRIGVTLNSAKKLLLAAAGFMAIAGPIAIGLLIGVGHLPTINAQSLPAALAPIAQLAQSAARTVSPAPRPAVDAPVLLSQAVPGGRGPAGSPQSNAPTDSGIIKFKDRRLIAMFFDLAAMTPDEQANTRQAATNYVQSKLQPADLVAILTNGGGTVQVAQDFTADPAVLQSTIQKLSAGTGASETPDEQLANIATVTKLLAGFPEKKQLMYFTSGLTTNQSQSSLQNIVNAAKQANMAIFPIDTHGLSQSTSVDSSALSKPMDRIYQRYGAPTQIEDRGTSKVWRYSYLDDFHGNAAFEFSTVGGIGVSAGGTEMRMLYPPPAATFEGKGADPSAFVQIAHVLTGGIDPVTSPFPGTHTFAQLYGVVPGNAPSADRRWLPLMIPLTSLSGTVEIAAQVKSRPTDGSPVQVKGALRDSAQASVGTYQSAFTVPPGSYAIYVVVQEKSTGRTFGEEIDIDAQ